MTPILSCHHVMFSTRDQIPYILDEAVPALTTYIRDFCRTHHIALVEANAMADHIHLLLQLPPARSVSRAVGLIKANTSRWLGRQCDGAFQWREDYGVFSVSPAFQARMVVYIRQQKAYHRHWSYQEELVNLSDIHGTDRDWAIAG